jgi:predicted phosphoribosyltransferase
MDTDGVSIADRGFLVRFHDRRHAGQVLAGKLRHYRAKPGVVVLALPRGGVPVGFEVALALDASLDVFIVRKLGVPGHEEYAMGAIATGDVRFLNPDVAALRIPDAAIQAVIERERRELKRREVLYRDDRPPLALEGLTVILVDDGLATGSTMQAAVMAVRQRNPQRIVVAVPVAAPETCAVFQAAVDEVICAITPEPFRAVGVWYDDFGQTSDEEVRVLLDAAWRGAAERAT